MTTLNYLGVHHVKPNVLLQLFSSIIIDFDCKEEKIEKDVKQIAELIIGLLAALNGVITHIHAIKKDNLKGEKTKKEHFKVILLYVADIKSLFIIKIH